ncbi:hypothetical protein PaeBR_01040 [Paenibacillus sp. BR2-3]|uniref:hypothetical protein n=1 Tax=Paenibacillus sp. BR2-3 TaxID=3048494 RepID=UPI0039778508
MNNKGKNVEVHINGKLHKKTNSFYDTIMCNDGDKIEILERSFFSYIVRAEGKVGNASKNDEGMIVLRF